MALITCKDCKKDFSTDANSCPHCGANKPNGRRALFILLAIFAFVAFVGLLAGNTASNTTDTPPLSTISDERKTDLTDANALDKEYDANAILACASDADDYLRSIANYDFKWDDLAWYRPKFDQYRGLVPQPGVLIMTSKHAKLSNGFGAFKHIELDCYYDTQKRKVLRYSATQ